MNYNKLESLTRIYNTLLLVNTHGEDTLVMADCLNAMRAFIANEQKALENTTEITQSKEE